MTKKHWFVLTLALPLFACGGESLPSDDGTDNSPDKLSREDVKSADKADWPVDYCNVNGWYGDGALCDDFCPLPDPDCASSCEAIGGTCLSDPMDVGFGANCAALGRPTLQGSCEAFNQTCCGAAPPPATCEAMGGTCMSDPGDPGFGALCEDLGMQTLPGSCEAFNQTCCGAAPPPATCEAIGGICMSDPMDVGFGANCEELGRPTLQGSCEAFNQTCCGAATDRTPVEGLCIKNSGDTCATDDDCVSGGCGGELCFNPAVSGGASTCECGEPQVTGCGCVAGRCTWYD
jgi:hypothetical protein